MPVDSGSSNKQLLVAALFSILTNWDETEARTGRRGEYRTTGASMFRVRELQDEDKAILAASCAALGVDVESEEIDEIFGGDYEYQVSFACNRFPSKSVSVAGIRLTGNEMRTVERLKQIAAKKPQAVAELLKKAA